MKNPPRLRRSFKRLVLGASAALALVWCCSYLFPVAWRGLDLSNGLLRLTMHTGTLHTTYGLPLGSCLAGAAILTLILCWFDHRGAGTTIGAPNTKKTRRIRRILKWSGVTLCALLLAAWGLSTTSVVRWRSANNRYHFFLGFSGVGLSYWRAAEHWPAAERDYFVGIQRTIPAGWGMKDIVGTNFIQPAPQLQLTGHKKHVLLPMWLLFPLVAAPTALLFYSDRRRIPPGHCRRCGYNLTGNVSGVCPECGATSIASS